MLKEHYMLLEEEIRSKQRLAETIKEKIDFIDKVIDNNIELEKFSFEDFQSDLSYHSSINLIKVENPLHLNLCTLKVIFTKLRRSWLQTE